jgi:hypothetical protein
MPNSFYDVQTQTTDKIHNFNCYQFLKALNLPSSSPQNRNPIPEWNEINHLQNSGYDEKAAYGDLYTQFMVDIERLVTNGLCNEESYDKFFISLYENDNQILEGTFDNIKSIVQQKSPSSPSLEKVIAHKMRDRGTNVNSTTPAQSGSMKSRALAFVSPYFKPSHRTSLATVRRYNYNKDNKNSPKELRFGTQGQIHGYAARVSPLFNRFLTAQHRRTTNNTITHVYFNKLGRDRSPISLEGRFETGLTRQLEQLDNESPNIAVITLPADKGLIDHHDIADLTQNLNLDEVFDELLHIAAEDPQSQTEIKDFHMSEKVRGLLFPKESNQTQELNQLLLNSFNAMGIKSVNNTDKISPAMRQAIWMHFVNYELPSYILKKLEPKTFNFSCKDAIDRGGIASAFYNLLNSLATDKPMSREEFEQALHAAPLMVKGRGINAHINILWNVLDCYISANPKVCSQQQWLVRWRDANCPPQRAGELLERRLNECIDELKAHVQSDLVAQGLEILEVIQSCDRSHAVNHPLWLDAVVSTYELSTSENSKDTDKIDHYKDLISKVRVCDEKPVSYMEAFVRLLRYLFRMQQPLKKQSKSYSGLVDKMGQWHASEDLPFTDNGSDEEEERPSI